MSKFNLNKIVKDISKYQKVVTKKKKETNITLEQLENALNIALIKLIARDGEKYNKKTK